MHTKSLVLLSVLSVFSSASFGQSPYEHRDHGLALGAVVGALTGGAIGHNNGKTAGGALIGGAVGALAGAAIGNSVDSDIARNNAVYEQRLARQLSDAVSVQDVMAMSQAKLSDGVIVTQIKTHGVVARLQPNDLILLSNAGVSDVVISAMQTATLAVAPAAPTPAYRNVIVREHYYAAARVRRPRLLALASPALLGVPCARLPLRTGRPLGAVDQSLNRPVRRGRFVVSRKTDFNPFRQQRSEFRSTKEQTGPRAVSRFRSPAFRKSRASSTHPPPRCLLTRLSLVVPRPTRLLFSVRCFRFRVWLGNLELSKSPIRDARPTDVL